MSEANVRAINLLDIKTFIYNSIFVWLCLVKIIKKSTTKKCTIEQKQKVKSVKSAHRSGC